MICLPHNYKFILHLTIRLPCLILFEQQGMMAIHIFCIDSSHKQQQQQQQQQECSKPSPNTVRRIRAKKRAFCKIKDPNGDALEYRKNDVLLGRGGHASNNPGNLYLLRAVRMSSVEYKSLGKNEQDKVQKRAIVQHIISLIEDRGSRFLYREKKGDQWREASSRAVYEKISHMLRD